MNTLLLVEDNESLGPTLQQRLRREGYEVLLATTVAEAQKLFATRSVQMVIIDVDLPDGNGIEFAQRVVRGTGIPFLFLSAMSSAEYRLEGFEIGAEDYIPKPFHLKELLLRIARVLESRASAGILPCGEFSMDLTAQALVFRDGRREFPQKSDFELLKLLVERSPKAVSRPEILQAVWGSDLTSPRTVDNAVVRLRQLLGPLAADQLRSVRGVGYQFVRI